MDVLERNRQLFYQHMGHSGKVNAAIYQASLVLQEVANVGCHLLYIDNHTLEYNFISRSQTCCICYLFIRLSIISYRVVKHVVYVTYLYNLLQDIQKQSN